MKISHPFNDSFSANGYLMTTTVQIVASCIEGLAERGIQFMESLVKVFNYYDVNSELSKLNNSKKNTWVKLSDRLYSVLHLSKYLQDQTKNFFRVDFQGMKDAPNGEHGFFLDENAQAAMLNTDTKINLGGIGKGFIVDQTYEFLLANGADNILVNAGGDIRVKSNSYSWKLGLHNPYNSDCPFGCIQLKTGALATSGTYARHEMHQSNLSTHFYDTENNLFMESPPYVQVSIVGDTTSECEVYAKCILMGKEIPLPKDYYGVGVDNKKQVKKINYGGIN